MAAPQGRLAPEEVRQAQSDLEAADADLVLAREEHDRITKLFLRQTASRAETAHQQSRQARASVRAHDDQIGPSLDGLARDLLVR